MIGCARITLKHIVGLHHVNIKWWSDLFRKWLSSLCIIIAWHWLYHRRSICVCFALGICVWCVCVCDSSQHPRYCHQPHASMYWYVHVCLLLICIIICFGLSLCSFSACHCARVPSASNRRMHFRQQFKRNCSCNVICACKGSFAFIWVCMFDWVAYLEPSTICLHMRMDLACITILFSSTCPAPCIWSAYVRLLACFLSFFVRSVQLHAH